MEIAIILFTCCVGFLLIKYKNKLSETNKLDLGSDCISFSEQKNTSSYKPKNVSNYKPEKVLFPFSIYEDGEQIKKRQWYQKESDKNKSRVNYQGAWDKDWKILKKNVPIVELAKPDKTDNFIRLAPIEGSRMFLERDPDNLVDEKAIKVMISATVDDQLIVKQVGYLPDEIVDKYANDDLDICPSKAFLPTQKGLSLHAAVTLLGRSVRYLKKYGNIEKKEKKEERSLNFVAIDFETANPKRVSACSIGYAIVSKNEIIETDEYLIDPVGGHAEFQSRIHGITEQHTRNMPSFGELFHKIKPLFNYPLIAHSSFDEQVLNALIEHFDLSLEFDYIDNVDVAKKKLPGLKNYKLKTLAKHFDLPKFKHHNAAEDAATCAKIFLKLQGVD